MAKKSSAVLAVLALLLIPIAAYAAEEAGRIVYLKGPATIIRGAESIQARMKAPILVKDTIATGPGALVKVAFKDESILTIGENSETSVADFKKKSESRWSSTFNMAKGFLRTVVGKTDMEVRTPTVVAAARGTVVDHETGEQDGEEYTDVTCLEGSVDVSSADPDISGVVKLGKGKKVRGFKGKPLPEPADAGPSGSRFGAEDKDEKEKEGKDEGPETEGPEAEDEFEPEDVGVPPIEQEPEPEPEPEPPAKTKTNLKFDWK